MLFDGPDMGLESHAYTYIRHTYNYTEPNQYSVLVVYHGVLFLSISVCNTGIPVGGRDIDPRFLEAVRAPEELDNGSKKRRKGGVCVCVSSRMENLPSLITND